MFLALGLHYGFGMDSVKMPKPHEILNTALLRKQERTGGYSQRVLAREMGVSPTFLSKVLTGKKVIPTSRLKKLSQFLDMDINLERHLMQAVLYHSLPTEDLRQIAMEGYKPSKMMNYKPQARKKFGILKNWYNLAILDLLTCDIELTPKIISKKLNISLPDVEHTLKSLETEGLAVEKDGIWEKTEKQISFPTTKTQVEVREFHKQMIKKAYEELSKSRPQDFEDRLITGATIAVSPKNLAKAKQIIFNALSEVANCLSEDSCEEVYQMNVQLFPLTKKVDLK